MKLILLFSKKPKEKLVPWHRSPYWYVEEDFYRIREDKYDRIHMPVIRYDEFYVTFYIIRNADDGYRYRNTIFKKL